MAHPSALEGPTGLSVDHGAKREPFPESHAWLSYCKLHRMDGEGHQSAKASDAEALRVHLEMQLARVDHLYDVCIRDYFSTFDTYATATSIFLFGMLFVVEGVKSSVLVVALGIIGIFLCLQWHISTTTMRDQYSHFHARMLMLEEQLDQQVMRRWNVAAKRARGRPSSLTP